MEIKINIDLQSTLTRLAQGRNITEQEYVQNYIENHLRSQYQFFLVEKIQGSAPVELAQFETVLEAKRVEIQDAKRGEIPTKRINPDEMIKK